MMNRIILIGNGFDLAHGLRTSYADFINSYKNIRLTELINANQMALNDGLCQYELANSNTREIFNQFRGIINYKINSNRSLLFSDYVIKNTKIQEKNLLIKYRSEFFENINKQLENYCWVDVEATYYAWLIKILKKEKCNYPNPKDLNKELHLLKTLLVLYLSCVQINHIRPSILVPYIQRAIYEPLRFLDIANGSLDIFKVFLEERWKYLKQGNNDFFILKYNLNRELTNMKLKTYNMENVSSHIENVFENQEYVPDCYLLPDKIMVLNFNYTSTADMYINENRDFTINHIHGQLGVKENPIIFGYGDEMDDNYKELLKLNDNEYLINIKSIRYLETDNYRKLLSFIDSAPFQIYIMGHSCGNSDRTLLNTLFEHKNCVSIKPFYYEKPDGSDNYIEIIQNISRNFNDMRLMRDRVVNKTYCRPLIPQGK